jgi:hypothetical protein
MVEHKRYEIATLPSSGLRAGLSVARNDNLAAGGAYQDFVRAKRIPLALRDGAKEPRLLSANGMRPDGLPQGERDLGLRPSAMAYRLIQRAWRLYYAFILEDAFSEC